MITYALLVFAILFTANDEPETIRCPGLEKLVLNDAYEVHLIIDNLAEGGIVIENAAIGPRCRDGILTLTFDRRSDETPIINIPRGVTIVVE